MRELEVFIFKLCPIDAFAACSIASRKIPALEHEARNHAMEVASFVAEALLPCAESYEILTRMRHNVSSQLDHNAASRLAAD